MFSHHEETILYLVDSKYSICDDAVTINSIIPINTLAEVSQSAVAGACNETLYISVEGKQRIDRKWARL